MVRPARTATPDTPSSRPSSGVAGSASEYGSEHEETLSGGVPERVLSSARVQLCLPHIVEVGGIEPPSRETSAPASPSAANSELSDHEDSVGKHPHDLSGVGLTRRSRNPGGSIPHCVALICRGGYPTGGQERLTTLPVRNFRLHLYVYRLFYEDSGDLGSLPAPQLSRSKPCHPRMCGNV